MRISIVIPTYYEQARVGKLIEHIRQNTEAANIADIIVVDAHSNDGTAAKASEMGATVIISDQANRACQMNLGAWYANGQIIHFIHADAMPPVHFDGDIIFWYKAGYHAGCFRSLFNTSNRFLRLNSYFSRFSWTILRGGGQTLFVDKQLFKEVGGFNEEMKMMEEYELIGKLKRRTSFKIIQRDVMVSSRDYAQHGAIRLQSKYAVLLIMYFMGFSQNSIIYTYKLLFRKDGKKRFKA